MYSNFEPTVDLQGLSEVLTRHRRSEATLMAVDPVRPVPLTAELRVQIVELYEAGKLAREIGAEFGVSKTRVLKVLHEAGVTMRPGGPGQRQA